MIKVFHTAFSGMKFPMAVVHGLSALPAVLAILLQESHNHDGLYNILWALVFGFATLNILGLLARRSESGRNRLSFGEITAILVVVVSVLLLLLEMLNVFKIFPIRLNPH